MVLARNQTEVGGDLASVFKAMRIVDAGDEDLGRPRSDAGNRHDRVECEDRVLPIASSFLTTDVDLRGDCIELSQFDDRVRLSKVRRGRTRRLVCETS